MLEPAFAKHQNAICVVQNDKKIVIKIGAQNQSSKAGVKWL